MQEAEKALELYEWPLSTTVKLLNYSENSTYLMEDLKTGAKAVLRIHRPNYHTKEEIEAELEWMEALLESSTVVVPKPIPGRNSEKVQTVNSESGRYHCVMFSFLPGKSPEDEDERMMVQYFKRLGEVTARLHDHAQKWERAVGLRRFTWDYDTMIGRNPRWGRWQDGPDVTQERGRLFQRVSHVIRRRLAHFGKSPNRYGLVHADLRLANLLVDGDRIQVIDFDDCGFSWFLYDLASALSFIEHKRYVSELIAAWLEGYRTVRPLSREEEAEIPTFIMLRRLMLLAWLGSHADSDTAREVGEGFAEKTAELAEAYLLRFES